MRTPWCKRHVGDTVLTKRDVMALEESRVRRTLGTHVHDGADAPPQKLVEVPSVGRCASQPHRGCHLGEPDVSKQSLVDEADGRIEPVENPVEDAECGDLQGTTTDRAP